MTQDSVQQLSKRYGVASGRFGSNAAAKMLMTVLLFIGAALHGVPAGRAQEQDGWSTPRLLFEQPGGYTSLDYLMVDPSGAVHLFWASNPNSLYGNDYREADTTLYYQKFYSEGEIGPNDILLNSSARLPFGAVIDHTGGLHVLTSTQGPPCLTYLRSTASDAWNPRAWTAPRCLEEIGVGAPDLAIDPSGLFYGLFIARYQDKILLVESSDEGQSWSSVKEVATTSRIDVFMTSPRLAIDTQGRLHATWGEVQAPSGYPWQQIWYARSDDGGETWSLPMALADSNQGQQNLAVDGDVVYVVWNGDAGYQGRYYRWSNDGGLTWSARFTLPLPATSGGLQGAPAIVIDSKEIAHIIYPDSPHLYYVYVRAGEISAPILIAGPDTVNSKNEIDTPMLGITNGNLLHALYTRDAQAVYYQQRVIDAPAEASIPWPDSLHLSPPAEQATASLPEPTSLPAVSKEAPSQVDRISLGQTPGPTYSVNLLLSLLPAFLVVLFVVLMNMTRPRRY